MEEEIWDANRWIKFSEEQQYEIYLRAEGIFYETYYEEDNTGQSAPWKAIYRQAEEEVQRNALRQQPKRMIQIDE